jgi:Meiotically up-regulated gene 113
MIYFVQEEFGLFIKIGFNNGSDLDNRLRTLQVGCPGLHTLLLVIPGTKQDDRELKRRFRKYKLRGEWFRPVPELLRAIDDAKASRPMVPPVTPPAWADGDVSL